MKSSGYSLHLAWSRWRERGSHVKLRRVLPDSSRQTLTIPAHAELDIGTLRAIYRQALRYVPEDELHPHFYTD